MTAEYIQWLVELAQTRSPAREYYILQRDYPDLIGPLLRIGADHG